MCAALSIVSRIDVPGVAGAMLFAGGERLAIWSDGAPRVVDAATGRTIVALASKNARLLSLEDDGPLALVTNHAPDSFADMQLWDMSRGVPLATLLPRRTRISEIEISKSMISCMRLHPSPTCFRFDRSGALRDEIGLPGPRALRVLVSTDGPKEFWNYGWRAAETLDPASGACTPLEQGTADICVTPSYTHWTLDGDRAHLAFYAGTAGRARVWKRASGSTVRGPWEQCDLRDAYFVGERFVAIAPDATFVTYAMSGEIVARGGLVDDETPRPWAVDDDHVAFRAPSGRGVSVWNVHEGVEVARVDAIEGLEKIVRLTARDGRIAVADQHGVVVLQLDES